MGFCFCLFSLWLLVLLCGSCFYYFNKLQLLLLDKKEVMSCSVCCCWRPFHLQIITFFCICFKVVRTVYFSLTPHIRAKIELLLSTFTNSELNLKTIFRIEYELNSGLGEWLLSLVCILILRRSLLWEILYDMYISRYKLNLHYNSSSKKRVC